MPFKFRLIQRQPLEVRKMTPSTNWPVAHPAYSPCKNMIGHCLNQSLTSRATGSASSTSASRQNPGRKADPCSELDVHFWVSKPGHDVSFENLIPHRPVSSLNEVIAH